jgi:hypothetical protein
MYYIFENDGTFAYTINTAPVSSETRTTIVSNMTYDQQTQKPRLINGEMVFEDYIQTPPPEVTE